MQISGKTTNHSKAVLEEGVVPRSSKTHNQEISSLTSGKTGPTYQDKQDNMPLFLELKCPQSIFVLPHTLLLNASPFFYQRNSKHTICSHCSVDIFTKASIIVLSNLFISNWHFGSVSHFSSSNYFFLLMFSQSSFSDFQLLTQSFFNPRNLFLLIILKFLKYFNDLLLHNSYP